SKGAPRSSAGDHHKIAGLAAERLFAGQACRHSLTDCAVMLYKLSHCIFLSFVATDHCTNAPEGPSSGAFSFAWRSCSSITTSAFTDRKFCCERSTSHSLISGGIRRLSGHDGLALILCSLLMASCHVLNYG